MADSPLESLYRLTLPLTIGRSRARHAYARPATVSSSSQYTSGRAGCYADEAAHRSAVRQQRDRQASDLVPPVDHRQLAVVRDLADDRGGQVPRVEDGLHLALAAPLDDDQHPLLGFGKHHVVRRHLALAPRHERDVDARAGAGHPACAFGHRGSQACGAEVLDRDHRVGVREVHARLQQALLEERVADLDRGPALRASFVELDGGERCAMNSVAPGVRPHQHQPVARAFGTRPHELVGADESDAHRVDDRVVRVAVLEVDLASDRRDADAVAVGADARDHALEVAARLRQRPEPQRVEEGDGTRAHGDDVTDDPADAGGSALVRLDRGRVVVRLDLEDRGPAFPDAHRAGVLARTLDHGGPCRGQAAQERLRALVRAVLRPEHAEHAELDLVRRSFQLLDDGLVLIRGERDFSKPSLIHRFDTQDTKTFSAFSATDRNSFRPSVPASQASGQPRGCGIMPSTLPRALTMPAMLCSEPFGFAAGTTLPAGSQYRNTTWPLCSRRESVAGSAK